MAVHTGWHPQCTLNPARLNDCGYATRAIPLFAQPVRPQARQNHARGAAGLDDLPDEPHRTTITGRAWARRWAWASHTHASGRGSTRPSYSFAAFRLAPSTPGVTFTGNQPKSIRATTRSLAPSFPMVPEVRVQLTQRWQRAGAVGAGTTTKLSGSPCVVFFILYLTSGSHRRSRTSPPIGLGK